MEAYTYVGVAMCCAIYTITYMYMPFANGYTSKPLYNHQQCLHVSAARTCVDACVHIKCPTFWLERNRTRRVRPAGVSDRLNPCLVERRTVCDTRRTRKVPAPSSLTNKNACDKTPTARGAKQYRLPADAECQPSQGSLSRRVLPALGFSRPPFEPSCSRDTLSLTFRSASSFTYSSPALKRSFKTTNPGSNKSTGIR